MQRVVKLWVALLVGLAIGAVGAFLVLVAEHLITDHADLHALIQIEQARRAAPTK